MIDVQGWWRCLLWGWGKQVAWQRRRRAARRWGGLGWKAIPYAVEVIFPADLVVGMLIQGSVHEPDGDTTRHDTTR